MKETTSECLFTELWFYILVSCHFFGLVANTKVNTLLSKIEKGQTIFVEPVGYF